jgi:hypothetical protein
MSENKAKWTVSVDPRVSELVDEYVLRSETNRSLVVEEALKLWLKKLIEEEEEAYYKASAAEINSEMSDWVEIASESAFGLWKDL